MDLFQITLLLVSISVAYFVGHWRGYGRGEQDTRELTEEIRKLSKKQETFTLGQNNLMTKGFRQNLHSNLNFKSEKSRGAG